MNGEVAGKFFRLSHSKALVNNICAAGVNILAITQYAINECVVLILKANLGCLLGYPTLVCCFGFGLEQIFFSCPIDQKVTVQRVIILRRHMVDNNILLKI